MSEELRPRVPRVVAIPGERLDADQIRVWAQEAIAANVPAIQLRCKHLSDLELWQIGSSIRTASDAGETLCMVNGRADLAFGLGWTAVHLPSLGLPVGRVRSILGDRALVGRSTHSVSDAVTAASEGADYVFFGPIFDTASKRPYGPPLGLERLREAVAAVSIPVLAIGGVAPNRFTEVAEAGAHGIAAIGIFSEPRHASAVLDAFTTAFEG